MHWRSETNESQSAANRRPITLRVECSAVTAQSAWVQSTAKVDHKLELRRKFKLNEWSSAVDRSVRSVRPLRSVSTPFICVAVWVVPYCLAMGLIGGAMSGSHFGCHLKLNYLQRVLALMSPPMSALMQITSTALQQSLLYLSLFVSVPTLTESYDSWGAHTNTHIEWEPSTSVWKIISLFATNKKNFCASSPASAPQLSSAQLQIKSVAAFLMSTESGQQFTTLVRDREKGWQRLRHRDECCAVNM